MIEENYEIEEEIRDIIKNFNDQSIAFVSLPEKVVGELKNKANIDSFVILNKEIPDLFFKDCLLTKTPMKTLMRLSFKCSLDNLDPNLNYFKLNNRINFLVFNSYIMKDRIEKQMGIKEANIDYIIHPRSNNILDKLSFLELLKKWLDDVSLDFNNSTNVTKPYIGEI